MHTWVVPPVVSLQLVPWPVRYQIWWLWQIVHVVHVQSSIVKILPRCRILINQNTLVQSINYLLPNFWALVIKFHGTNCNMKTIRLQLWAFKISHGALVKAECLWMVFLVITWIYNWNSLVFSHIPHLPACLSLSLTVIMMQKVKIMYSTKSTCIIFRIE